jgi:transketolase
MEISELQKVASQVRRDIVRQVHACQSGHPGGSLGCTDLLVGLYFDQMTLKSDESGKRVFDMNGTGELILLVERSHLTGILFSVGSFRVFSSSRTRNIP